MLYGITLDDVSSIKTIVQNIALLPEKPTTRVVFDWNKNKPEPTSGYLSALRMLHPVSNVMGELLDSTYEKAATTAEFSTMVTQYVTALAGLVDIWEIGNEINGNWTGPYSSVSAKLVEAFNIVKGAHGKTALTLYLNDPNGTAPFVSTKGDPDGSGEPTPLGFAQQYIPANVAQGLDYVLLSYYETDQNNIRPSAAWFTSYFEAMHAIFPNALLGFGEVGMDNPATSKNLTKAESIMSYYYSLKIPLPYYIGGYFWWYAAEDCLAGKKLLQSQLSQAFTAESVAAAV